jgi:hypothetical protein
MSMCLKPLTKITFKVRLPSHLRPLHGAYLFQHGDETIFKVNSNAKKVDPSLVDTYANGEERIPGVVATYEQAESELMRLEVDPSLVDTYANGEERIPGVVATYQQAESELADNRTWNTIRDRALLDACRKLILIYIGDTLERFFEEVTVMIMRHELFQDLILSPNQIASRYFKNSKERANNPLRQSFLDVHQEIMRRIAVIKNGSDITTDYFVIYKYGDVVVHEMLVEGIRVFRREGNSFINATQMLAAVAAPSEILQRLQSIPTAYYTNWGEMKGLWIPLADAIKLCSKLSITDVMKPLLTLDDTNANTGSDYPVGESSDKRPRTADSIVSAPLALINESQMSRPPLNNPKQTPVDYASLPVPPALETNPQIDRPSRRKKLKQAFISAVQKLQIFKPKTATNQSPSSRASGVSKRPRTADS